MWQVNGKNMVTDERGVRVKANLGEIDVEGTLRKTGLGLRTD